MLVRMVTFNTVDLLQSFPDKSSFVHYLFQYHTSVFTHKHGTIISKQKHLTLKCSDDAILHLVLLDFRTSPIISYSEWICSVWNSE
jgi:hypothetical protein